ncbi:hypothetical protein CRENBAI_001415 [Crenichthys baileyi]|uniref:Uncharacterized protein n=1 Tax=Crenichthys baileyi TaxID=28760 RepID=A0AAV9SPV2_9TELE
METAAEFCLCGRSRFHPLDPCRLKEQRNGATVLVLDSELLLLRSKHTQSYLLGTPSVVLMGSDVTLILDFISLRTQEKKTEPVLMNGGGFLKNFELNNTVLYMMDLNRVQLCLAQMGLTSCWTLCIL